MRQILKTATCLVFISDLQKSIYEGFFFRSGIVIPNGVSECRCLTKSSKREPDTVLFAGRSAGKGLENLISQINASNFILHLAGGPELEIIAATHLDSSKFIYHGLLNQGQLFELMHTVAFVSVISECFDVFPSVSLEAMRHGALVLCNRTIGSANLVEQFSSFTVLKYNTAPDLNRLSALSKIMPVPRLKILRTPQEVLDHYIITIKSIETC
jgi:glycosyltransferase involved in cell wall biosynthesis